MTSKDTEQPGHDICPLCGKILTSRHEKSSFVEYTIDGVSYDLTQRIVQLCLRGF